MDAPSFLSLFLPSSALMQPARGMERGKEAMAWDASRSILSPSPPVLPSCRRRHRAVAFSHLNRYAVRRGMLRIVDQKKVCSASSVSFFAVILRVERRLLRERGTVLSLLSLVREKSFSLNFPSAFSWYRAPCTVLLSCLFPSLLFPFLYADRPWEKDHMLGNSHREHRSTWWQCVRKAKIGKRLRDIVNVNVDYAAVSSVLVEKLYLDTFLVYI